MNTNAFRRKSTYAKFMGIALLAASISLTSCEKDEEVVPEVPVVPTPPAAPANPTISFTDGNGTLTAVKSRTFQKIPFFGGFQAIDLGVAVAVFYDDPSTGTFLDAGAVECQGGKLKKQDNNSYVYTPGLGDTQGLDTEQGDIFWEVEGSSSVDMFDYSNYRYFPEVDKIDSESEVKRTEDYTLSSPDIYNADSVIYMIGGIYHTAAGSTSSYIFTKDELATLKAGANYVQIAAYNITEQMINGKTYHFVNETVVTESVTIQ